MIINLFRILFFLLPLVFYKATSELFEFNKIITLYIFTILIVATWIIKSIKQRKLIFRRTILDIPIILYLLTLLLSTLFSIDPRTSWFGYYSRFNGGMFSQISYALLYFAFVSNLSIKQRLNTIYYALTSIGIASLLAVLEHFGFFATCGLMGFGWKESCWVQDVQNRVFSTLGQPNWLAAALVALLPISNFQFLISNQFSKPKFSISKILWGTTSLLFFITLLFTKSKSGLLAFGISSLIFWGFLLWKEKGKFLKQFLVLNVILAVLFYTFYLQPKTYNPKPTVSQGPALETGGTDSGEIRKNVWLGAVKIWQHYPIFGTGVETYAFAFPMFKPISHNLVSEWDFIYNKAHNEFLNYLATTGSLGFLAYISLIGFSVVQILKIKDLKLKITLLSGYTAILITNFFGFSVVFISLLFFILPALAVKDEKQQPKLNEKKLNETQWLGISITILASFFLIHNTVSYWLADFYYNKSKNENSLDYVLKSYSISPTEPLYLSQISNLYSNLALSSIKERDVPTASNYSDQMINFSEKAISLSPYNQNVKKIYITALTKLSPYNETFLQTAISILKTTISISPNDPKLYYQLGLTYLQNNNLQGGLKNLEKSVELKSNYKEARFALGLTYKDLDRVEDAKYQLEYILKKIDPNDELTQKYLEELN